MKQIPLTQNEFAQVDEETYEWLSQWKWSYKPAHNGRAGYACRMQCAEGKKKVIFMHRLIMDAQPGAYIDHINGNPLDNRRSNLRFATREENSRNQSKRRYNKGLPTSSQYKGVTRGRTQKWEAQIKVLGQRIYLGSFLTEIEAARAYDLAAREHFGAFARINFPETST